MSGIIDTELVRHIGKLSRIELTDQQVELFGRQLADILDYFDKLQELDTENVKPMVHAIESQNVFGEDIPGESLKPDEALKNAPVRDGNFFKVPKVIGDS